MIPIFPSVIYIALSIAHLDNHKKNCGMRELKDPHYKRIKVKNLIVDNLHVAFPMMKYQHIIRGFIVCNTRNQILYMHDMCPGKLVLKNEILFVDMSWMYDV